MLRQKEKQWSNRPDDKEICIRNGFVLYYGQHSELKYVPLTPIFIPSELPDLYTALEDQNEQMLKAININFRPDSSILKRMRLVNGQRPTEFYARATINFNTKCDEYRSSFVT